MQTASIDSNNFGEIRNRGYVYVDKTARAHRLATAEGRKMFFLARPRRFKGGAAESVKCNVPE